MDIIFQGHFRDQGVVVFVCLFVFFIRILVSCYDIYIDMLPNLVYCCFTLVCCYVMC